jgi:NADP-dependent aldehyde dehydrogenase
MDFQPILIDGEWRAAQDPEGQFQADNPQTGKPLDDVFPISSLAEIEVMLRAAQQAMLEIRALSGEEIANFLDAYAGNIEANADILVATAHLETALTVEPRLRNVELPRTTSQLRLAADAARRGDWHHAIIDTKNNIRSMVAPLAGPIVVFGPNNFPFAFNGVAGGDFAAAVASGHAVIAKANPAHPKTTQLLAQAAFDAIKRTGMPQALVQLFYGAKDETGSNLVSHPLVGATAFTGSRDAGMALKSAADAAGKPIYLEMSSVNPTFVLAGALKERGAEIAKELAGSCLAASGQFCTKPGLIILPDGENTKDFINDFVQFFQEAAPTCLLGRQSSQLISQTLKHLQQNGGQLMTGGNQVDGLGFLHENTALQVTGEDFLKHPQALQSEAFGPVAMLVKTTGNAQMSDMARQIEGSLTGCIYSDHAGLDDSTYALIEPILRPKVGRLLNDKAPTGVAVSAAMVHGGPPPSTGHAGFTSVGIPAALRRFGALRCYDNVRSNRLPVELQDKNPNGEMWRFIDGIWTQSDVLDAS